MHPLVGLNNLEMGKSDHHPICLDTKYMSGVAESRPKYGRKFEARWLEEETVEEIVKTAWLKAVHQGLCPSAREKLESVHKDIHAWDRQVLNGPRTRLKKAHRELENLMRAPYTDEIKMKQKELSVLIENLLDQDEVYWAQRGRVTWLLRGDRNTKYFN